MKKLLVITALAATVSGAFAQGNISWAPAARTVWDDFSSTGSTAPQLGSKITNVRVALLFGSSTATPLIAGISGNNLSVAGNGGKFVATNAVALGQSFSIATAWTDILGDGNFAFVDGVAAWGQGSSMASTNASATGAWSYNANSAWSSANLSGQQFNMYMIAWDGQYATPGDAQTAGGAVGWSQYFSYTPSTGLTAAPAFPSGPTIQFGVVGSVAPVPEPSTMALAALGGASLLLFRRRK